MPSALGTIPVMRGHLHFHDTRLANVAGKGFSKPYLRQPVLRTSSLVN